VFQSNGFLKAIDGTQKRQQYKEFYKIINTLILQRESSLLSKQVNIFTTNIDISARQETEPCSLMILKTGISEVFS
jgi:hypothetical protein